MNETMEIGEAARSWSSERPLAHLVDLTDRQDEMNATCSVDGCSKPLVARSWCRMHYQRWKSHGDVTIVKPPGIPGGICKVADCDGPTKGHGLCSKHYQRLKSNGDPLTLGRIGKPRLPVVGYLGAHKRVYRAKGSATDHQCSHCPEQAAQWAYDNNDPNERIGSTAGAPAVRYSMDPAHYMPLCGPCHWKFDAAARSDT